MTSYHSKWLVARRQGQTVGAIMGFSLPDPYDRVDLAEVDPVLRPMIETEVTAAGCWLLQAIALFPEYRGHGYGTALIERARASGHTRIVLQVESPNTAALSLYRRCGFVEWERRPYVPFPGSDDSGDWILIVRPA